MIPSEDDLQRLETDIAQHPSSEERRERLLEALAADPRWLDDPRRLATIAWFVEHNPRHLVCRTPFARVDPGTAPGPYARLKSRWLALVEETPGDSELVRGAAACVAAESLGEARQLLRTALAARPHDASLWLDLGRMCEDPRERLTAFESARENGETSTNLLVWIATTAVKAEEYDKARATADELLKLVADARARFGETLDLQERGAELWKRVRTMSESDADASELSGAISDHAYRHHFAHTVLGLLACREHDIDGAIDHLRASVKSQNDFRLSSYGPSMDLVREVCLAGRWSEAREYLEAWSGTWDETRLNEWIAAVKAQKLPPTGTET